MEVVADRLQRPFQPLNGLFVQLVDGAVELLGDLKGSHLLHGLAALGAQPEGFGILPIVLSASAACTRCRQSCCSTSTQTYSGMLAVLSTQTGFDKPCC